MRKTRIAVFGSTGSIGQSALEVIAHLSDRLKLVAIAAHQSVEQISLQAQKYKPELVILTDPAAAANARSQLNRQIQILTGTKALDRIAESADIDLLIMAMSGTAGISAVLRALRTGKKVALATKEILVAYGELVMKTCRRYRGIILPIDSELAALHQCLEGRDKSTVRRLILTASGGPFWRKGLPKNPALSSVLRHPTWRMGRKITVDSATLMNKGLEVIEAARLFNIKPACIKTVIHPESIVHSMVEFQDGSILAQLSKPDMRLPIQYCLTYPQRLPSLVSPLPFDSITRLRFFPVNYEWFPCLRLAYQALAAGALATCVLNAANEIAVEAFLNRKIAFATIPVIIENTLVACLKQKRKNRLTFAGLRNSEIRAAAYARSLIEKQNTRKDKCLPQ
jgi:1-deoxy-D-xylulose-5-phosphate reductoisomerase